MGLVVLGFLFWLLLFVAITVLVLGGVQFGLLAQISLHLHPFIQFLAELLFGVIELRVIGEVLPFKGVFFYGIQLFRRSVFIAVGFINGILVASLGLLRPRLVDSALGADIAKLDLGAEVEDVLVVFRAYRADAKVS